MKKNILIIDDDEKLNRLLTRYLSDFGFDVHTCTHPGRGMEMVQQDGPDLIILDIMLPDMDGFEVCRKIRESLTVPIIMLTARGEVTDKVVGLELGADDYLSKPFEPRELVARIQTVLRRSAPQKEAGVLRFGNLEVDITRRTVIQNGVDVNLTTHEWAALLLLTGSPGKVYDRDEILQELKGMDCEAYNRSVDITMSRLRHKLGDDPKHPKYIKTVWGAGYVFIGSD